MARTSRSPDEDRGRARAARAGAGPHVERVRKRDGREVPFQVDKIRAAIAAAMDAVGEPDADFASEVAHVVELTLAQRLAEEEARLPAGGARGARAPQIEEIQDLVERALMELGRPAVAKAYILYRDQRARVREVLRVHPSRPAPGATVRPRVRESEGVSEWTKGRIVASLMEESGLPRNTADEVASAVERRVFASRLRRVTTGLIRELVSSELFERGLTRAIARQSRVGVAPRDVRAALRGLPLQPWREQAQPPQADPARVLGEELLRRHVLDGVLDEGIAELHHAGDLHFEGLGAPTTPLSLSLEADLLAPGGASPSQAYELLDALADLAGDVARWLVLERPAEVLQPLAASRRLGRPSALGAWLRAVAALARAAGVRLQLGASGEERADFTAALVAELAELGALPGAPGLFLDARELEAVLAAAPELAPAAETLLAEGRLAVAWSDGDERLVAPGCRRRRGERGVLACSGAVALDLVRLARRAGPHREELVQRGLAELVQASLEAARALERFRASAAPTRARGLRTRHAIALVPVGLREALSILGDGDVDPDQGARLLGLLAESAGRFALEGASVVAPSPFFGETAAARFLLLDRGAAAAAAEQTWLFADVPGAPAGASGASRGTGTLTLSPLPGQPAGAPEARLLRTVTSGVHRGLPLTPADAAASPEATPQLDAWRRFEALRRRDRGERSLELFPAPSAPRPEPARRSPLRPLS